MYESKVVGSSDVLSVPPQVLDLATRERELATLIYVHGGMTATALSDRLSVQLDNSSIRSMLNRLCRKGILTRRKRVVTGGSCGRRIAFLYLPAITPDSLRKTVLKQVARDYFDGSLLRAAQATMELMAEESTVTANGPRRSRAPKHPRIDIAA